ncbi:glycosyl hydrolase family 5 [Pseudoroseicyclus sp. CLL3-39]|uniref:cellulase n=2 Tax=Pseudoroseicyclus tamaricis TaxID=2705421 RepID=A0A6B2JKM5_9RHOB|nr:glycosyl hydrolase family 5 [Pseudoroseicyclus tamaricis]
MNRRHALAALLSATALPPLGLSGTAALAQTVVSPHPLAEAWALWKTGYLAEDGRVVDELQQGASHSESQSYGLLLAATIGDEAAFDLIDDWTMRNLAVREDRLLAWRWLPDMANNVPDLNNASDGDLFYAWALIRGAERFDRPALRERAAGIARDLAATCMLTATTENGGQRLLFVPAAAGFEREEGNVLNLSYYMPRAMEDVAEATGITAFAEASRDGIGIMTDLAIQGLIPDWITVAAAGGYYADEELADRNGYEAMRVPLFLIWSGFGNHPAVRRQAEALHAAEMAEIPTPTVMDRVTYAVRETSPDAGYAALGGLVTCASSGQSGAAIPRFRVDQPYYPATLHLFALLAQIEATQSCVPI